MLAVNHLLKALIDVLGTLQRLKIARHLIAQVTYLLLWNPPGIVLVEYLLIIPTTVVTKGGKEGFVIS